MAWSERQRKLLGAIGVRLWGPAPVAAPAPAEPAAPRAAAPAAPATSIPATVSAPAEAAPVAPRPPMRPPAAVPAPATPAAAPVVALRPAMSDDALAALDWDGLRAAVAACTACSLSGSRTQTVFGVGHAQAEVMIVGEAPGEKEDEAGEPFVGPAGQLLDQMLRAVGLSRQEGDAARQVFIANTLKCRPPRNRNPEPAELACCEPYLRRQIALVRPRLIVAMGRFAVRQLLGTEEAIGKLRGRVHRHEGIPVVVTYHPAYLLRNLPDKARAWDDLCLAASTLETAPPR